MVDLGSRPATPSPVGEIPDPWPTVEDALEAATLVSNKAREMYGEGLIRTLLYGSRARGDHDRYSDLDILLVLKPEAYDPREGKVSELLDYFWIELPYDLKWVKLSVMSATVEQVENWDTTFYRNVRADALEVT
ncbi:MAG: nucleotidyltransferase domain-containing protein [Acidimicrobiia bacterium]|nr:nucleotidyltransferase domain-containing protein [bacterium]MXX63965.1 nucleotidyltransferase domain-containing protein [Acidimicrobiia bacterium]MCY3580580.1 nucleotidyltransferase domain-containing protein [bacterium]MCY3651838.1 nucleotidyltransferase domain-containing protein [bacterium]MDE0642717.1 nucleotidyltransferase domain-containing protein [bacterium]